MKPRESFIEQPVRSLQTMLRVIAEDDSRNPTVIPDGIYGPSTMNAVSSFQRRYGLPVTGITDQNTWDKVVSIYEPALIRVDKAQPIEVLIDAGQVFRFGDSAPYVYLLQSMLTQLSQDHLQIKAPGHSGIMDEQTVQAISAFQRLSGLEQTGELDRITWKHLVHQFVLNASYHMSTKQGNTRNEF